MHSTALAPAGAPAPASHALSARPGARSGTAKFLSFTLAGEIYAMPIERVKEIIEFGQLTSVPMMPDYMRGVINLRGAVVPVIDMARRFGKPATVVGRRTCIVIVELTRGADDARVMGVMVDAVNAVLDIEASAIEPPPSFGTVVRPDFLTGMAKVKGRFVVVLDVEKTLSVEDLLALREATQTRPAGEAVV